MPLGLVIQTRPEQSMAKFIKPNVYPKRIWAQTINQLKPNLIPNPYQLSEPNQEGPINPNV